MRVGDFKLLWAGQTVSLLGSAVTIFALPTLAVLTLHATPAQVGVLTALETLPFPVLGLFVGVLADRVSRRRIMIGADIVRFAVLASVPIAAAFGLLEMPQLYAVALLSGTASAFFGISYQAYLPVIVEPERLPDANMKLEFSNSGSTIAGNALAGMLVQWIGAAAAVAVDAVSYLVSVASLALIRRVEPRHEGPPLSIRQAYVEMLEGARIVFRSPDLRWIAGATATTNFGASIAGAVMFIYAYRILRLQPGPLGVVFGLAQIGFVGAILSGRVRNRLGLRGTLLVSLAVAALGESGVLVARLGFPYVVLFASSALTALAVPIYNVNQISYRQALVDVRMQGRLNATMRTLVWGTMPAGAFVGGYLGGIVGIPVTIAIGAALSALATLWLLPLRERAPAGHPGTTGP